MTTAKSPVVILSCGNYEPSIALFVNGVYMCSSIDAGHSETEVIELRAKIIADAIGCEVEVIETFSDIPENCKSDIYILERNDWHLLYTDLVNKKIMPEQPEFVKKRISQFLHIDIYS